MRKRRSPLQNQLTIHIEKACPLCLSGRLAVRHHVGVAAAASGVPLMLRCGKCAAILAVTAQVLITHASPPGVIE